MDVPTLEEIKNKRGELKTKVVRITNKTPKKGLDFDSINTLYQELLKKYKPENILIIGKPLDGGFVTILDDNREKHVTLKHNKHLGSDLKHADDDYYSSLPKEVKKKLQGKYYSVDITISMKKEYKKRKILKYLSYTRNVEGSHPTMVPCRNNGYTGHYSNIIPNPINAQ